MKTALRQSVGPAPASLRRLKFESLEERRLLDAGSAGLMIAEPAVGEFPWQNPVYRLDVNNDLRTTPTDALIVINRVLSGGIGDLPDPGPNPPPFYYDTNGDNRLSASDLAGVINGLLAPPVVTVSSLTPYTADVTPIITVTTNGTTPIADGTPLDLDVDLNNDGDFGDPGELAHTQSTTFAGSSTFQLAPLARTGDYYTVGLRARLKNADAVVGTSPILPLGIDTFESSALADYVHAPDPVYSYFVADVSTDPLLYITLRMTSQTWRSTADVTQPVWEHWVEIYVPEVETLPDTAFLFIDSDSTNSSVPMRSDDLSTLAVVSGSVVVNVMTPLNQPLQFTDQEDALLGDGLVAYTYRKFLDNLGAPGNETWLVALPMVKSVVRAMDTVQDFAVSQGGFEINRFVLGSFRARSGWVNWLTAGVDERVGGVISAAYDFMNYLPETVHEYGVRGTFASGALGFSDQEVIDLLLTSEIRELFRIVDPYRYLATGLLEDVPKLMILSPGDSFYLPDAAQFYFDDIPGDNNYLRYIPNTGHFLDQSAAFSALSFYNSIVTERPLPDFTTTIDQDGKIHAVMAPQTVPDAVTLWVATNPEARDFENGSHPGLWSPQPVSVAGPGHFTANVPMPESGATAYFIEMEFFAGPTVPPHVFTTRVNVKSAEPYHAWPGPFVAPQVVAAALEMAGETRSGAATLSAAAVALAFESGDPLPFAETIPHVVLQPNHPPATAPLDRTPMLVLADKIAVELAEDEATADLVFAETSGELLS